MAGLPNDMGDFWARVEKSNDCWNWTGYRNPKGYGRVTIAGIRSMAHRLAYEEMVGPIPAGMQIDHLCRNRCCVNPAHMEIVDNKTNALRGESFSAVNAKKTHCPRGHPYDEHNTWVNHKGGRECRTCRNRASLEWWRLAHA